MNLIVKKSPINYCVLVILLLSLFGAVEAIAHPFFPNDTIATNEKTVNKAADYIVINDIVTKGNKRTKDHIIFRELDFKIGDTLTVNQLEEVLAVNRNQVFNTRLFNDVNIELQNGASNTVDVVIAVEERWYIYPAPIFELADRNFNVWWKEQKRDFSRVEYGMRFTHKNFRGRKERLKAVIQLGYTKKFELSYTLPFLNKQGTTGLKPFISYITNNEALYGTQNNNAQFYDHKSKLRSRFRTGIDFNQRPDIQTNHYFSFAYNHNQIADTLALLNPDYFLEGKTKQKYLYLAYIFTKDQRDIQAYPLTGRFFRVMVEKQGLGIFKDLNMLWVKANYTEYLQFSNKFYGITNVRGKASLVRSQQPYYNQSGLNGGADYVRGYELYIIDGQDFAMARTALKYELFNTKFTNPILKIDQFKTINLAVYFKTFAEIGYANDQYYDKGNPLSNQWLTSTGIGIDVVTMYDTVFTIEYTRNRQNEWGLFISFEVNYD